MERAGEGREEGRERRRRRSSSTRHSSFSAFGGYCFSSDCEIARVGVPGSSESFLPRTRREEHRRSALLPSACDGCSLDLPLFPPRILTSFRTQIQFLANSSLSSSPFSLLRLRRFVPFFSRSGSSLPPTELIPSFSLSLPQITIKRIERNKRKYVTTVLGLETFGSSFPFLSVPLPSLSLSFCASASSSHLSLSLSFVRSQASTSRKPPRSLLRSLLLDPV